VVFNETNEKLCLNNIAHFWIKSDQTRYKIHAFVSNATTTRYILIFQWQVAFNITFRTSFNTQPTYTTLPSS
jgi:hypothetical protein